MRLHGVSPLPMRLNTLERVLADKPLQIIRNEAYTFFPNLHKNQGSAVGTIYEEFTTKSLWLGKIGDGSNIYGSMSNSSFFLPNEIKTERRMNGQVILEYIASDFYRVFGDSTFETPVTLLHRLPVMNEFLRHNELARTIYQEMNISSCLRFMSKWVPGYKDLSSLRTKDLSFIEYVNKFSRPPEEVIDPNTKKRVELKGVMGVLAAATSLRDVDVFGSEGNNTGYVFERDSRTKKITRCRIVKIDPGLAFSYDFQNVKKKKNDKDIQYSTGMGIIKWDNLTQKQKDEFLEVKRHDIIIMENLEILDYLFFREGKFHKNRTEMMPKELAEDLRKKLVLHMKNQSLIYSKELKNYEKRRIENRKHFFHECGEDDLDKGDYDRCLQKYEKDFEIIKVLHKKDSIEYGKVLGRIGRVERFRGCLDRSEECLVESVRVIKEKIGENNESVSDVYNDLGLLHFNNGEYEKSIDLLEKSISIVKNIEPKTEKLMGSMSVKMCNLGTSYLKHGNYENAEKVILRSVLIQKNIFPENHIDLASGFDCLGNIYEYMGMISKSIGYYEEVLKIANLEENHPNLGSTYNNLGNLYGKQGRIEKGVEYLEKGLDIHKASLPEVHQEIATTTSNLGVLYIDLGDYSKALDFFQKGLEMEKILYSHDHPDIAMTMGKIGIVYTLLGEFEKAEFFLEKSISIQEVALTKNSPVLATSYANMGSCCNTIGKYEKAVEFLNKALTIQKEIFPEYHPDIAHSYSNLGTIFKNLGLPKKAIEIFEKALKIDEELLNEKHPDLGSDYNNLGLMLRNGRFRKST